MALRERKIANCEDDLKKTRPGDARPEFDDDDGETKANRKNDLRRHMLGVGMRMMMMGQNEITAAISRNDT